MGYLPMKAVVWEIYAPEEREVPNMRGNATAEVEVEEDQFNHALVPAATSDSLPIAEMQRIIPGVEGGVVGVIANYQAPECKKSLPVGFVA